MKTRTQTGAKRQIKTKSVWSRPEQRKQSAQRKNHRAPRLVKNSTKEPRSYPELVAISVPFVDAGREMLACRIRDEAGIPLPLARDLLSKYRSFAIEAILNSDVLAAADSPGGMLRYLLMTGAAAEPADLPQHPTAALRISPAM